MSGQSTWTGSEWSVVAATKPFWYAILNLSTCIILIAILYTHGVYTKLIIIMYTKLYMYVYSLEVAHNFNKSLACYQ